MHKWLAIIVCLVFNTELFIQVFSVDLDEMNVLPLSSPSAMVIG